jgi:hypothetical protein
MEKLKKKGRKEGRKKERKRERKKGKGSLKSLTLLLNELKSSQAESR